jgi:hypothetical protein
MRIKSNCIPASPTNTPQPLRCGLSVRTNLRTGKALGDCCAGLFHFAGLDKLAALYTQSTGKDCGCKDRQNLLNNLMPKIPWI